MKKEQKIPEGLLIPPASKEVEVSLLGSILISPEVLPGIVELVSPSDFYYGAYRVIAEVIWDFFNKNTPIDVLTVHEELIIRKHLEMIGGSDYYFSIPKTVPGAEHAEHYARLVKRYSVQRSLIAACREITEETHASTGGIDEIVDNAEAKIFRVSQSLTSNNTVTLSEGVHTALQQIDEAVQHKRIITGVPTGYYDLDDILCGLQPGELIILAARPSIGKTSLALNITRYAALREKQGVLFFSLESSTNQIVRNLIAAEAQVDSKRMRSGYLALNELQKIGLVTGVLSDAPIWIDDTIPLSTFQLKSKARRLKAERDIKLVVVDYLQLLHPHVMEDKPESREREIAEITYQLKALAKELKIPVLAIAQLNRMPENRKDSEPKLSDLRESGEIEQTADVVLLLWRKKDTEVIVKIEKQRNGMTGIIKLFFIKSCLRFVSAAKESLEEKGGGDES